MALEKDHAASEPRNSSSTKTAQEADVVSTTWAHHEPERAGSAPSVVPESAFRQRRGSFFQERPLRVTEVDPQVLRKLTRRDVLIFGASAISGLAVGASLLPQTTLERLGLVHENKKGPKKSGF